MSTTDDKLEYTLRGVEDAWTAVEQQGVTPPANNDIGLLGASIREIEAGQTLRWTYPANWVPEPEMPDETGTNAVYKIYPEQDTVAFYAYTDNNTRYITVDWGDGLVETNLVRGNLSHTYDYESLTSPVTEDGSKTVLITIRATVPATQPLSYIRLSQTNGLTYNNLVFYKTNCDQLTQMAYHSGHPSMNQAYWSPINLEACSLINVNRGVSFSNCFQHTVNLRTIDLNGESIVSSTLSNLLIGTRALDGLVDVTLNQATGTISYAGPGLAGSAFDELIFSVNTTSATFTSAYFLSSNFYCMMMDVRGMNAQCTITPFTFTNDTVSPLEILKFNLDSFKTTANQTISFGNLKMLNELEIVGTMGANVTTITFNGSGLDSDIICQVIPHLLDRTSLAAGTFDIQFTSAVTSMSPADRAAVAAKNWNLVT